MVVVALVQDLQPGEVVVVVDHVHVIAEVCDVFVVEDDELGDEVDRAAEDPDLDAANLLVEEAESVVVPLARFQAVPIHGTEV